MMGNSVNKNKQVLWHARRYPCNFVLRYNIAPRRFALGCKRRHRACDAVVLKNPQYRLRMSD